MQLFAASDVYILLPWALAVYFGAKTRNMTVSCTYTTTKTPRQLGFARLTPQIVAYDAWGGCCAIGMVWGARMAENDH